MASWPAGDEDWRLWGVDTRQQEKADTAAGSQAEGRPSGRALGMSVAAATSISSTTGGKACMPLDVWRKTGRRGLQRQAEQTIPLLLARWLCNCDWDVMPTPLPLPIAMPTYSTARQPRATERAEAFGGRGQGSPATHWTHALCCPTLVDAQWVSIVRLRRRHCIGHAQGRTVSSHHQFHPF